MMRFLMVTALLLGLASCGADGAPSAPEPGVTVSGEAQIGVEGTL